MHPKKLYTGDWKVVPPPEQEKEQHFLLSDLPASPQIKTWVEGKEVWYGQGELFQGSPSLLFCVCVLHSSDVVGPRAKAGREAGSFLSLSSP